MVAMETRLKQPMQLSSKDTNSDAKNPQYTFGVRDRPSCSRVLKAPSSDSQIIVLSALQSGPNLVDTVFTRNTIYALNTDGKRTETPSGFKRWYSDMTISPDGQWMAYSTIDENAKAGGNSDIFITDWPNQRILLQVTTDRENDASPSWSPDSKSLLYEGSVAGRYGIYMQDVYCMMIHQSCEPASYIADGSGPAWSPDGSYVAYSGWPDPIAAGRIMALKLATSVDITAVSPMDQYCHQPRWSPDSTRLTFYCQRGLYLVSLVNNEPRLLVKDAGVGKWSPDGEWIAFDDGQELDPNLGRPVGLPTLDGEQPKSRALFLIKPDGTNLRRISTDNYQIVYQFLWMIQ